MKILSKYKCQLYFLCFLMGTKYKAYGKKFLEIYDLLCTKTCMSTGEIETFELKTKNWLKEFLKVYLNSKDRLEKQWQPNLMCLKTHLEISYI